LSAVAFRVPAALWRQRQPGLRRDGPGDAGIVPKLSNEAHQIVTPVTATWLQDPEYGACWFGMAKEGTMKATLKSAVSAPGLGRGLVGVAAASLLASTLTLIPTTASAVDIRGIVRTAIALHYSRFYMRHSGGHAAVKRDRDDADDDSDSDRNRKSAGTSSSHNQPSRPSHGTHEVAQTGAPSEAMVSLDRSLEEPDSRHGR
jgi:hypothetical protein